MTVAHIVALDVDGTTINHAGELSPAVREAVHDVLDPHDLSNPGKLLPTPGRCAEVKRLQGA